MLILINIFFSFFKGLSGEHRLRVKSQNTIKNTLEDTRQTSRTSKPYLWIFLKKLCFNFYKFFNLTEPHITVLSSVDLESNPDS